MGEKFIGANSNTFVTGRDYKNWPWFHGGITQKLFLRASSKIKPEVL